MSVGSRIRYFRNKKGLSQQVLGDEIGLSSGAISNIELGVSDVNTKTLQLIAKALDVQAYLFLMEEGENLQDHELRYGYASKIEIEELRKEIGAIQQELKMLRSVVNDIDQGKKKR